MNNSFLELTPVEYNSSSTVTLHLHIKPFDPCFLLHWHDRMEFLRMKKGRCFVKLGTNLFTLNPGEIMLIPPKTLHQGHTLDEGAVYDVLMFDVRSFYNDTPICKTMLPAIFDGRAIFNPITTNNTILECMDCICNTDNLPPMEITSKIYRFLNLLLENELVEFRSQPKNAAAKKIVDHIETNFSEDISIAELCKKFGYTSAHLCRIFKKTTGLAPMAYLKIYRLEFARQKIINSDASISDIASECGFADANYFTRCFRSHFGIAPLKYRNAGC